MRFVISLLLIVGVLINAPNKGLSIIADAKEVLGEPAGDDSSKQQGNADINHRCFLTFLVDSLLTPMFQNDSIPGGYHHCY